MRKIRRGQGRMHDDHVSISAVLKLIARLIAFFL